MIESRAARPEELDSMLALMCEAFGLPFEPARELFYKDPYFDIEKKRVLVVDGEIVSCLTIVEAPIWIGRAPVKVGGIAGVATLLDHRRKGYAARLLSDTVPALQAMGCPFSALFPFSYNYYRKLGWDRIGTQYTMRTLRENLPAFSEARHVRNALPHDRHDLADLYNQISRHKSGRWIRDERRWNYLLEHVKHQVVYKRGRLEGYAFFDSRDDGGKKSIRIMEMFAASEDARRGLTGYFAEMKEAGEVSYACSLDEALASGLPGYVADSGEHQPGITQEPGIMFRLVDIAAAMESLAPNFEGWEGEVVFAVSDSPAGSNLPAGVYMEGKAGALAFTAIERGDARLRDRNRIEGDTRAWTQTMAGYYSIKDAVSLNRLRSFTREGIETVELLFPHRDVFVPPADHF